MMFKVYSDYIPEQWKPLIEMKGRLYLSKLTLEEIDYRILKIFLLTNNYKIDVNRNGDAWIIKNYVL